jgi:hypothetical protein
MPRRTVEEQIARLRPGRGFARRLPVWLFGLAAVLCVTAAVVWHPVPLMVGLFFGLVGLLDRRAGPNIVAALEAYDTLRPVAGEVEIEVTTWSDSDSYHAMVCEPGQPAWTYPFMPQGWTPVAGRYPARIWRAAPGQPPALVAVADGILVPRTTPKLS